MDRQFLDADTTIWGTALSNLPQRMVATLTVWESAKAATDYMRNGAHGAAMREHHDPSKEPTGHTFVTGGGFFGFRSLSVSGSCTGSNPPPVTLESTD